MKELTPEMHAGFVRRIQQTIPEQKEVLEKIKAGTPLLAEDDSERKIAYLQKRLNASKDIVARVANYEEPENLPLSKQQQSKAESLQGSTVDFMNVFFFDVGRAASRSIARVTLADGNPLGTGFMVSPSLFLTNNHVIRNREQAAEYLLEFNYELDYRMNLLPATRFRLNPSRFFLTNSEDDLDFTLVAIGDKLTGVLELADIGYLPLVNSEDKHIKGTFVNCIQHPNGNPKQIVVRENRLLARTPNTLIYSSDTLPGASGSPVFNDSWEVVALHHWGEPYRAVVDQTDGLPKNGNEGIRISAIMNHLAATARSMNSAGAALLEEALNNRRRLPTAFHDGQSEAGRVASVMPVARPRPTAVPQPGSNGTVTFTIPLTVTVQVGTPLQNGELSNGASFGNADEALGAAAGKFVPDPTYSNRKGYDPNFLGVNFPLPRLTAAQQKQAAPNKKARAGDNPVEFKYEHFSVVMNGRRRVAFFTAVNIDGSTVIKINRDTGKVTRGPEGLEPESVNGKEGREPWYDDPRIDTAFVCNDDVYTHPDMRHFQRGHLVKRTDPSWGTVPQAFKGQADTFHFTNCSPQHEDFNPNASRWAGVENWITNTSDDENIKVTVFCGPVFGSKDPTYNELKVPKAFWKVIVWRENNRTKATAILADQSMLLKGAGEALAAESGLDQLPAKLPKEYHCSIAEVEKRTGLNFGNVKNHDVFTEGESLVEIKPLANLDELFARPKKTGLAKT